MWIIKIEKYIEELDLFVILKVVGSTAGKQLNSAEEAYLLSHYPEGCGVRYQFVEPYMAPIVTAC